ncbi:cupin domain-containing protein [Xylaria sp. FL1777]|nr:cupin domain-containing protein [Xylaria sp. FL1777]
MSTSGPLENFPAPGLRTPKRIITGHNEQGNADFLQANQGDHLAAMLGGAAAQSIIYSVKGNPIQITGDVDLEFAKNNRPSVHVPNGVCVRMIDFAPGTESNLHRALTLGIGTVCEGEIELTLSNDRSKNRVLRPGDVCINRCALHRWRNVSADKPARMLFVMLDVEPVVVKGKTLGFDMGDLMKEYAEYENES